MGVTIRVSPATHARVREIAAETGSSPADVVGHVVGPCVAAGPRIRPTGPVVQIGVPRRLHDRLRAIAGTCDEPMWAIIEALLIEASMDDVRAALWERRCRDSDLRRAARSPEHAAAVDRMEAAAGLSPAPAPRRERGEESAQLLDRVRRWVTWRRAA